MSNNLKAIHDIEKAIESLDTKLFTLDGKLVSISKNARNIKNEFNNITTPNQVSEQIKQSAVNTQALNENLREQARLEKALASAYAKKEQALSDNNKLLIQTRYETQQINKALKEEAILNSKNSTAIQKAVVVRNKLARQIQDLVVKKELGNKLTKQETVQLKQAEMQYKRYDKAVRGARERTGRFFDNVGNYKSGLSGLLDIGKQLIGVFGAVQIVQGAFALAGEMDRLAREAKGVEFAFRDLGIKGIEAFENIRNSTRGLVSDLEIKRALVDFNNFNISLEQTDTLFEFLAVRSAQTGKSVDSLKDSLVEGLSKESKLRIDNLGISAAALNEELEKTPNFVEAVANIAKTEIAEAGDILDETANTQERFNAAYENFLLSSSSGAIGGLADQWRELKTEMLGALTVANDASESTWEYLINLGRIAQGQGAFVVAEATIANEQKARIPLVDQIIDLQRQQGIGEEVLVRNREQLLRLGSEQLKNIAKDLEQRKETNDEVLNSIGYYEELIATEQKRTKEATNKAEYDAIMERIKGYEREIELIKGKAETEKALRGSIKFYQNLITELKKQQTELSTTTEIWEDYEAKIIAAQTAIKMITGEIEALEGADPFSLSTPTEDETNAFLQMKMAEVEMNKAANDAKLRQDQEYYAMRDDLAQQFYGAVINLTDQLFARQIQNIDDEIERNRDKYATLLDNENLTEQERQQIEAERERKERELEKKRREEQRKSAIFKKALAVAEIAISTREAVAEASPNPFLIALAVAVGAAQLAGAIATPIPQYEKGKNMDSYEGEAIWGEKRREVRIGRRGIELSPRTPGNHRTYVYKDDIIHPDANAFFAELDQILTHNEIAGMTHSAPSATYLINTAAGSQSADRGYQKVVDAIVENRAKLSVHNKIELGDQFKYMKYYNDTL